MESTAKGIRSAHVFVMLLVVSQIVVVSVPSPIVGLSLVASLISLAGSIAMIFVQPDARHWRTVALINVAPYLLWFSFIALLQFTHS